ncbi:MAG: hypothetical protein KC620_14265, partial [Myxococcales bacterium]|nr:hypothetical protein [Myxococcales bacterium]
MAPSLLGALLAAIVTYVAPDGVYLDEGADDGVRVGDVVQIGEQRLTIEAVAPGRSRATAPPDVYALQAGMPAQITRTGAPAEEAPTTPRKATPPPIAADVAARWWPAAADGWTTPRPLPAGVSGHTAPTDTRVAGLLALDGQLIQLDALRWQAGATFRLAVDAGGFWYRHDARAHYDPTESRYNEPLIEVRRLELGWRGQGFGLRAGRMALADPLAAAALDGAAIAVGETATVQLFAGAAPDALDLRPEARHPQVGLAARVPFAVGDAVDGEASATALASGFDGA